MSVALLEVLKARKAYNVNNLLGCFLCQGVRKSARLLFAYCRLLKI